MVANTVRKYALGSAVFAVSCLVSGYLATNHLAHESAPEICGPGGIKSTNASPLGLTIDCRGVEDGDRTDLSADLATGS